jgi:hypothetical protein
MRCVSPDRFVAVSGSQFSLDAVHVFVTTSVSSVSTCPAVSFASASSTLSSLPSLSTHAR